MKWNHRDWLWFSMVKDKFTLVKTKVSFEIDQV